MPTIHMLAHNPDNREIQKVVDALENDAVIIFPTDTVYAIGCLMTSKKGIERVIKISGKREKQAKLSLICEDLKEIADYTLPYNNHIFKTMKRYLPGPYTFILNASTFVTRFFKNNKREIGIRIPDHEIVHQLVSRASAPIICTSLNKDDNYYIDPEKIENDFKHLVDFIIDGGIGDDTGSTILNCVSGDIELVRAGKGTID